MTKKEKLERLHETMKSLRFGVEVETVRLGRSRLAEVIAGTVNGTVHYVGGSYDKYEVTMQDGRKWGVVRDGSLSGYDSGEITTPILTYTDLELLQSVVRAVRAAGAHVDTSCGIHVHVDGAKFLESPKAIRALVKLIYSREEFVEAALGIQGTHRRNMYAQGISQRIAEGIRRCGSIQALGRLWYGQEAVRSSRRPSARDLDPYRRDPRTNHYHGSRYHGVNLHSLFYRGTIEFRWFNGSLHAGEIKSYVHLVLAFAARSLCRQAVLKKQAFDPAQAHRGMRRTLRKLGLVGKEFKSTREHLLKRLPKSAPRPRAPVHGPVQERPNLAATIAAERRQMDAAGGSAAPDLCGCVDHPGRVRIACARRMEEERLARAAVASTAQAVSREFVRPNGHLAGCTCIDCGAAYMAYMVDRQGEVARG